MLLLKTKGIYTSNTLAIQGENDGRSQNIPPNMENRAKHRSNNNRKRNNAPTRPKKRRHNRSNDKEGQNSQRSGKGDRNGWGRREGNRKDTLQKKRIKENRRKQRKMKTENFKRKDGTEGTKNVLEPGDEFIPRFESPRKNTKGKYDNWSIGIKTVPEGKEVFVQLTKGQAEKLNKMGNVQNKKLVCYEYESHDRKCVGIKAAE